MLELKRMVVTTSGWSGKTSVTLVTVMLVDGFVSVSWPDAAISPEFYDVKKMAIAIIAEYVSRSHTWYEKYEKIVTYDRGVFKVGHKKFLWSTTHDKYPIELKGIGIPIGLWEAVINYREPEPAGYYETVDTIEE